MRGDSTKSITGVADDFSWLIGADVSRTERDFWLTQAQLYESSITIDEKQTLSSIMFVAGLISPSPDDAWRLISKKASKEMLDKVGEKGAKKFLKAATKYAGKQGANGIKKLSGSGISVGSETFRYEVKVISKAEGKYRLLGNLDDSGNFFFKYFEKTH